MRKLLIITCLMSTVFIAFGQKKKKHKKGKEIAVSTTISDTAISYKELGASMPPIRMVMADKKVITDKDLDNGANLFVMMFNPTCGHCQDATVLLGKNIELFKKSKVVLLAAPGMENLFSFFESVTDVSKYAPAMQVGLDSADFITKAYRYEALPQINVYNKDRKLVKIFVGDVPIKDLKEYIE
jgi:thiol-disulfide isomerase/thioredoxin